eukprot:5694664-Lingulodinium_polyedra.AAC.1
MLFERFESHILAFPHLARAGNGSMLSAADPAPLAQSVAHCEPEAAPRAETQAEEGRYAGGLQVVAGMVAQCFWLA